MPGAAGHEPALTTIFLDEIERLLRDAAGVPDDENAPPSALPRLGAVSFLHTGDSHLIVDRW